MRINLELTDLRDEPFIGYPSSPPSAMHQAVTAACRQAGFTPRIRQEVAETSSLVALVAAGLGIALAPASVRHLRINGATHRPLRGPAQATVMLAVAYKKGPVSPLIRGYLETTRAVLRSQKQPSPGPSFKPEAPSLPESI
jgi:DNA-binding transcriptional LysR family regulator